jgi:hypothetical protein
MAKQYVKMSIEMIADVKKMNEGEGTEFRDRPLENS